MSVDFYILEQASEEKSRRFACQCIEKAYNSQKKIYLQVDTNEEAERMDKLLWTFRDDSFLPHQLYPSSDHLNTPILIGYGEVTFNPRDMLINLSKQIPSFYKQFNHVIEIVFDDPTVQQLARERYRQYRDQGCEINTHRIK